ncbi:MAG: transcriptional regulator [Bacteroidetes bacterium CG02_land_8_20_14_3_00_31_25]|nr:DUF4160 domain-containing protein [Bacteroidota bacterium]OFX38804.1 MAG: transcriptional regulator [Bacteroidetes bacterium GWA2_32_17]PIV62017.1 MAG: transcriptional regulator [Bacteroidetes bacterium CG02_land_8_20_14_3_00_31_25]PIY04462.1 MAG: transcriptional regulator [Bacteroidetes bacterium CG_4_10_14_3_um_filter_31_20]
MPIIARFYGIIIQMYWEEHNPPHLHAEYQGNKMQISIKTLEVKGDFPARAKAMVFEWLSLHLNEIMENWELAQQGKPLKKIEPLK